MKHGEPRNHHVNADLTMDGPSPQLVAMAPHGPLTRTVTSGPYSIEISGKGDGGGSCQCDLYVKGEKYEAQEEITRMADISIENNKRIAACALSSALRDVDLLQKLGLIDEHCAPIPETASQQADHIMLNILATAGFRRLLMDVILEDEDRWEVYDLAAGRPSIFGRISHIRIQMGALICAIIQLSVPAFFIFRKGPVPPEEDLTWDVYVSRLLFTLYAISFEMRSWSVDDGDRITAWLCRLPEFRSGELILGMLINKLSIIIVDVAFVILMLRSYSVFDITIDALALHFLLKIDDDLVNEGDLNSIFSYQKRELRKLKTQTKLYLEYDSYAGGQGNNTVDIFDKGFISAKYNFSMVSKCSSSVAVIVLALSALWMIVEPFVLGWNVNDEAK